VSGDATSSDIHAEAVAHARLAERSGAIAWRHIQSEYTQDVDQIMATVEQAGPWTWTLPNNGFIPRDDDSLQYYSATSLEEIRATYENMRKYVQVWEWVATTELRGGWYTVTHGVSKLRNVQTEENVQLESITMFPVGATGILGEVQIGDLGVARENRWDEVPSQPGEVPLPMKRLHALGLHNQFLDALRAEDVAGILATMRPDVATADRDYTSDEYTVVTAKGPQELAAYYQALFARLRIRDVQIVNRIAESWFVFAELYWTAEHRTGERAGEVVEFCTADIAPVDPAGRFWVRTGSGTDPLPAG
jgi:hypothetical protein